MALHHHHGAHEGPGEADESAASRRQLGVALVINGVFLIVEVVGGYVTGSLALLSDAGHMLTDVLALGLAIVAAHLAHLPPTPRRTFGLLRAEVLGAFINGIVLVALVLLIAVESYRRLSLPVTVDAPVMLLIAVLGLGANLASAVVLLPGRRRSLNMEGAFLHMLADALGSAAAIVAGVVIWLTGWARADAVASLVIAGLILYSSLDLVWRTLAVLVNATPSDVDYHQVMEALKGVEHFQRIDDLHIWPLVPGLNVLTAHVRLDEGCYDSSHWQQCLHRAQLMLRERFGIEHATLQLEPPTHDMGTRAF